MNKYIIATYIYGILIIVLAVSPPCPMVTFCAGMVFGLFSAMILHIFMEGLNQTPQAGEAPKDPRP